MHTEPYGEIEIDLGRLAAVLWRRSGLIGLAAILCALLALLVSFLFITPQFQSSVAFCVSGCDVDSGMILLEMGQTLDAVILDAGVDYTREELYGMLSAETLGDTEFFRVTVAGADAREAKRIADAVARILPRRTSELIAGAAVSVADPAVAAKEPAAPNYGKNAAVGALVGFAAAVGVLSLREIFGAGQKGRFASETKRGRKQSRRRQMIA